MEQDLLVRDQSGPVDVEDLAVPVAESVAGSDVVSPVLQAVVRAWEAQMCVSALSAATLSLMYAEFRVRKRSALSADLP
jgi:hypothetical protein